METKNHDELKLPRGFHIGASPFRYEGEMFTEGQMREFAAAEREACAKVCDEMAAQDKTSNYYRVAARAIRSRK